MRKKKLLFFLILAIAAGVFFSQAKSGSDTPDFKLFGTDYKYHRLSEYLSKEGTKAVVVIFTSNHCPLSTDYEDTLIQLAFKYQNRGFPFIAVNPNTADVIPEDGFPQMVDRAQQKDFPYPYLYDETQKTALSYGATCTPEVFVVGKNRRVLYTGAVDNFFDEPVYLADALESILAGREIKNSQSQAVGCTIKYRK